MAAAWAESTLEKYYIFLNSFHSHLKEFIQRFERIINKKNCLLDLITHTHTITLTY